MRLPVHGEHGSDEFYFSVDRIHYTRDHTANHFIDAVHALLMQKISYILGNLHKKTPEVINTPVIVWTLRLLLT